SLAYVARPHTHTSSYRRRTLEPASRRERALAPTSTNTSPIVMMASPAFLLLLLLAVSIRGSEAEWCVCRSDANETALQETLDYACGQGADCAPVATGGSCHSPDSVVAHCSYAVNSYYQRSSQTKGATCDFGGTATLSSADPSTYRAFSPCHS
uniref:X8 domain-containing protein n=1 Tax=Aegilops tauschii subsp. strangulata TaxID=200361 RepID=A0A453FKK2_AEGTS